MEVNIPPAANESKGMCIVKGRMTRGIRLVSIFTSCFLLVQYTPQAVTAANDYGASPDPSASHAEEFPTIVAEETALREESTKHFRLSDGSYTAVMYDEPVHYQKGGEWLEIDNSLTQAVLIGEPLSGVVKKSSELTQAERRSFQKNETVANAAYCTDYLENAANDFKVHLPASIGSRSPVILNSGNHTLRFCFEGIDNAAANVTQPTEEAVLKKELQNKLAIAKDTTSRMQIQKEQAFAVPKCRSSVSYASIQNNVDLHYYLSGKRLKEDLVLHSVPQAESFTFVFTYTGLRAVREEDNSVTFQNDKEEAIFKVASPYMYDDGDGYSTDIAVSLEETATGCRYTLTPSREWLEDPARVYPVTLDPSTEQNSSYIHDNGVQESNPTTNYKLLNRLYIGTYRNGSVSQEGRMYIKFTKWPSLPTGFVITNARFNLNYYPTASYQTANNMRINVYKVNGSWNTDDITWKSQINIGASYMSYLNLGDCRNKTSGVDSFDVTAWVKAHYSNPAADNGIRLQPASLDTKTNRVCYISSDYSTASLRPIIHFDYTIPAGQTAGITNGGTYYLRNKNSGYYLDAEQAMNYNVIQYRLHGSPNQVWKVTYENSTGYYTFHNQYPAYNTATYNKRCFLSVGEGAGDNVDLFWASNTPGQLGYETQRFHILPNGDGSYRIVTKYNGDVLDVTNYSTTSPANVIRHPWHGGDNQRWYFEPANKTIKNNAVVTVNSNYNRQWAANYAKTYGPNPNSDYKYFGSDGGDCTNFVSQCIYAGTMPMVPSDAVWGITSKTDEKNWFYLPGVLDALDWYTTTFTSASRFNKHWGQENMRAYQTIEYASGAKALEDIDFLVWYLKKGDVIQIKQSDGVSFLHSMIICDDNVSCDGNHKGEPNTCHNKNKKEIIYAQHSDNFNNGHLRAVLKIYENSPFIFTKIKKDV